MFADLEWQQARELERQRERTLQQKEQELRKREEDLLWQQQQLQAQKQQELAQVCVCGVCGEQCACECMCDRVMVFVC